MSISIIIPAFNEEKYLPDTLQSIRQAMLHLAREAGCPVELIVVDNHSIDRTAELAAATGATVLTQAERNIAKARNTGAGAATGDTLVFIDADTLVPPHLFTRIRQTMFDTACAGGAVEVAYQPAHFLLKLYLRGWRALGRFAKLAQGATQFCRRDLYESIGGYDETVFMGEDVDFYWRLQRRAARNGQHLRVLRDVQVTPSCRRFDRWPLWKTLVWTNPLFIILLRRKKKSWAGWYEAPIR